MKNNKNYVNSTNKILICNIFLKLLEIISNYFEIKVE